jgi:hypothetical protein
VFSFRLKEVKDVEQVSPDGSSIKARMQQLAGDTAKDIRDCANTCDTYTKKKLVGSFLLLLTLCALYSNHYAIQQR